MDSVRNLRLTMAVFATTPFAKFIVVGGLNSFFGLGIYSLIALTNLPTWMALTAANLAGLVFNFFTTGKLVFRDISAARIPRFIICYGIIFVLHLELIEWLSPVSGGRICAMAIMVLPMALLSYLIQSRFVFNATR